MKNKRLTQDEILSRLKRLEKMIEKNSIKLLF